jgi:hypothetical protein
VIVSESYIEGIAAVPGEAYASLPRDADEPLSSPITDQLLEPVPWARHKITEIGGYVQLPQSRSGTTLQLGVDILHPGTAEYACGASVGEALDHLEGPLASRGDVARQPKINQRLYRGRP